MPLLTITALSPDPPPTNAGLAKISEGVSRALGRPVDDVWLRVVAAERALAGRQPETISTQHPTFELVTGALAPEQEARVLEAATRAIAVAFDVAAANVWGRFQPLQPGRTIADGVVR